MGAENYIFNFWPEIPWCEQVTTNFRIWDEIYYYIAMPGHNPEKQPVWTPVYYDKVADQRMTSCIVPVYNNNEHIASSGMDILLDDLIRRANIELVPGTSNIILSKEGDIIVHPDYNKKISAGKSILKVSECDDPLLEQIFKGILDKTIDSEVSLLPQSNMPYAVAYGKIKGPEWFYITIYDKKEMWSGVTKAVQIVFLSALLALLIELAIVYFTLTKNVQGPLLQLIGPIKSMIRGDFSKSIAESPVSEIEEIRLVFNEMQGTIAWQIESLKESKRALENEIEVREQAEEDRLIAYNQLQNIMDSANFVAIIATDTEGVITHFNSGAQQMLGYSENEVVGKQSPAIIHVKEEIDQYSELLFMEYGERVEGFDVFKYELSKGKNHLEKQWSYVRKDGKRLIVNLVVTSVKNRKNKIVGFLGIALDITRRKNAEKALLDYQENLEELIKQRTKDLEAATHEWKATSEELSEKNQIINGQNEELKSTLQNLKEAQAQLLHAEKMASLGVLTAGVAHEINNPLNFIMGAYLGLRNYWEKNTFNENKEQVGALIDALKTGVDRSSEIVQGLNQFSRSSASFDEDCDLHAIIDNSVTMLNHQIKNKIVIEKDFSNTPYVIKGNVGNLHQVFINVLGNALHSIESNGEIVIRTEFEKSKVTIIVTDTGTGISPENLKKVTDPFFTTKEPGKGTGLGMSISYNIIKEHKGELEIKSEEGKGTSVKIILPSNLG
jgi:PAS domain S-box-containing protein